MITTAKKTCTKCHTEKTLQDFPFRSDTGAYTSICRTCTNAKKQEWKKANPEKVKRINRESQKPRHERLKKEVFAAYGGECVCCHESDLHFLTLDHPNGVPQHHRKTDGSRISGTALLYLLRKDDYPEDCRILCWNCNAAFAYYGFCPHQEHDPEQRRYS